MTIISPRGSHAKKKFDWRKRYASSDSFQKILTGPYKDRLRKSILFHNDLNQKLREIGLLTDEDEPLAVGDEPEYGYFALFRNSWTLTNSSGDATASGQAISTWTCLYSNFLTPASHDPSDIETEIGALSARCWGFRLTKNQRLRVNINFLTSGTIKGDLSTYFTLTEDSSGDTIATTRGMFVNTPPGPPPEAYYETMETVTTGIVGTRVTGDTSPLYSTYNTYFPTGALTATVTSTSAVPSNSDGVYESTVWVEAFTG